MAEEALTHSALAFETSPPERQRLAGLLDAADRRLRRPDVRERLQILREQLALATPPSQPPR